MRGEARQTEEAFKERGRAIAELRAEVKRRRERSAAERAKRMRPAPEPRYDEVFWRGLQELE